MFSLLASPAINNIFDSYFEISEDNVEDRRGFAAAVCLVLILVVSPERLLSSRRQDSAPF